MLILLCVSKQGTTGNPKGATLSHHGILNNAFFVGEVLNYDQVILHCSLHNLENSENM